MNETTDRQEDAGQDSVQDNFNQTPWESEPTPNRRRRIRDGGLGGPSWELPDHPRRWRDRFKH